MFTRRKFNGALLSILGATGIGLVASQYVSSPMKTGDYPGLVVGPDEFEHMFVSRFNGYPTTYIPPQLRKPNTSGSCVHISTANILLSMGLYDLAQDWLDSYAHGEYSSRHIHRMEEKGLYFAVEVKGNPHFIDFFAGNLPDSPVQRVMGVSFFPNHVQNLLDIDPVTGQVPKAYILNNWVGNYQNATATEYDRGEFLSRWDRNGGWAFTIVGDKQDGIVPPLPPYPIV